MKKRGLPGQGRLPHHVGLGLVAFCLLERGRVGLAAGTLRCLIPPHVLGTSPQCSVPPHTLGTPWCPFSSPSCPVAPHARRRGWGPGGWRLIVAAVQKPSSVVLAHRHRAVSSLANALQLGLSGGRRSAGGSQCWVPGPGSLCMGREKPLPLPQPLLGPFATGGPGRGGLAQAGVAQPSTSPQACGSGSGTAALPAAGAPCAPFADTALCAE